MKPEMRILGIDDAPFDKFKDKSTLVIGTLFRGGSYLDGLMSTKVRIDGNNATKKIAEMINKSKFKPQIQLTILDGIAVAGFNVIDIMELHRLTKIPVIVVMRSYPDLEKIFKTLRHLKMDKKITIIGKAGKIDKVGEIYVQHIGISIEDVKEVMKLASTRSLLPEPIRVAHIIASGIKSGESRGRA
jgi:endonuclease V-like protein UPF0215 family